MLPLLLLICFLHSHVVSTKPQGTQSTYYQKAVLYPLIDSAYRIELSLEEEGKNYTFQTESDAVYKVTVNKDAFKQAQEKHEIGQKVVFCNTESVIRIDKSEGSEVPLLNMQIMIEKTEYGSLVSVAPKYRIYDYSNSGLLGNSIVEVRVAEISAEFDLMQPSVNELESPIRFIKPYQVYKVTMDVKELDLDSITEEKLVDCAAWVGVQVIKNIQLKIQKFKNPGFDPYWVFTLVPKKQSVVKA